MASMQSCQEASSLAWIVQYIPVGRLDALLVVVGPIASIAAAKPAEGGSRGSSGAGLIWRLSVSYSRAVIQAAASGDIEDEPQMRPWRNGPIGMSCGEQEEGFSVAARRGMRQGNKADPKMTRPR